MYARFNYRTSLVDKMSPKMYIHKIISLQTVLSLLFPAYALHNQNIKLELLLRVKDIFHSCFNIVQIEVIINVQNNFLIYTAARFVVINVNTAV